MSTENSNDPAGAAAIENFDLAERIAELHAQGILVGGDGPRDSLWSVIEGLPPGALERFLDREYRDYGGYNPR